MNLLGIGQIAVPVHDLERATRFYREQLGLSFLFQAPGMAFFDCSGVRLLLGVPEEEQPQHRSSILYFRVDDIQAAVDELKRAEVSFLQNPRLVAELEDHDLWLAFFEDSEGNTMALMSEVR